MVVRCCWCVALVVAVGFVLTVVVRCSCSLVVVRCLTTVGICGLLVVVDLLPLAAWRCYRCLCSCVVVCCLSLGC